MVQEQSVTQFFKKITLFTQYVKYNQDVDVNF